MLTFNLLPPEKQAQLNFQKKLKKTFAYAKVFVGLLFVVSLFMVFILVFLSRQKASFETQLKAKESDPLTLAIKATQEEVKAFNEELKTLNASAMTPRWSLVLRALASLTPAQISLERVSYEPTKERKGIVIGGHAQKREHLIAFEENLKGSPLFKNVTLPLSSLRKMEDISFLITLEIK